MTKWIKKIDDDRLDSIRDRMRQNRILSQAVLNVDLETEDNDTLVAVVLTSRAMTVPEQEAFEEFRKENPQFPYSVRNLNTTPDYHFNS